MGIAKKRTVVARKARQRMPFQPHEERKEKPKKGKRGKKSQSVAYQKVFALNLSFK